MFAGVWKLWLDNKPTVNRVCCCAGAQCHVGVFVSSRHRIQQWTQANTQPWCRW